MLKAKVLGALVAFGALGICSAAYADGTSGAGVYLGGNVGYGNVDYDMSGISNLNQDEDGLAGRAFVGYQFNEYVGVETGFTQFSDSSFKFNGGTGDLKLKTWAWDVVAKGILPFSVMTGSCNPFSAYVTAGAAYVNTSASGSTYTASGDEALVSESGSDSEWKPTAGAGLSYNFNKNLSVDVAYSHIFGDSGSDNHKAPNTDYVGLGVTYHFA